LTRVLVSHLRACLLRSLRFVKVPVGIDDGLKHDSAIHCDELVSLSKTALTDYIGTLSVDKLIELNRALTVALDLTRTSSAANFGVRPGTWVTNQTGNIGYTFVTAERRLDGRFEFADGPIPRERQHRFKSPDKVLSVRRSVFDTVGDQLSMGRAPLSVAMDASAIELHLPLVEAREQHWSVIQRPDAVVDLLETDPFVRERFAREDPTILPKQHPVVSDLARLQMTGVFDRRERLRIRPW
jgi:hypothetical protein